MPAGIYPKERITAGLLHKAENRKAEKSKGRKIKRQKNQGRKSKGRKSKGRQTVDLIVFRIKIRLFSGLGFLFIYFYFLDICIAPLLDILLRGALYMRWPM